MTQWFCDGCGTANLLQFRYCRSCGAANDPRTSPVFSHMGGQISASPSFSPYAAYIDDEAIVIATRRAALAAEPDPNVLIGAAADGLPLVLGVRRRPAVVSMLRAALGARGGLDISAAT